MLFRSRGVRGLEDFQPWLDRVAHFPEAVVDQAVRQIPSAWLAGDEDALAKLLEPGAAPCQTSGRPAGGLPQCAGESVPRLALNTFEVSARHNSVPFGSQ